MLQKFEQHIRQTQLFDLRKAYILLAVSGGMDSVCLAHLCHSANISFAIAHCNFQLRGEQSEGDASFTKQLAAKLDVPYYEAAFDTQKIAKTTQQSIQLCARRLRYDWLEQLRQQYGFDHIATAHHLNDSVETILYNFAKGCGLKGLHGIPIQNGVIVRPLLFASRAEIESFVHANAIAFREDTSNADTKYMRNRVRHQNYPHTRIYQSCLYSQKRSKYSTITGGRIDLPGSY